MDVIAKSNPIKHDQFIIQYFTMCQEARANDSLD